MKNLLIVPLVFALVGCASKPLEEMTLSELYSRYSLGKAFVSSKEHVVIADEIIKREGLTPEELALCRTGRVQIGFTKPMVRVTLGRPQDSNNYTSRYGTTSVWWYGYYPNLTMIRFGNDDRVSHISQ